MKMLLLFLYCSMSLSYAELGKALRISDDSKSHILRNGQKIKVAPDLKLKKNDLFMTNESLLLIEIYPGKQLSLGAGTKIQIVDKPEIKFETGILRAQISLSNHQKFSIQAKDINFIIKAAEFEVSYVGDEFIDLHVVKGEVEVSSPHVHTFVPEIIKAGGAFRFNRKSPGFQRRQFSPQFSDYIKFKIIPGAKPRGE